MALLSRLGTAIQFDDLEAETVVMKRDTVRPIDRADAAALRERFRIPEE